MTDRPLIVPQPTPYDELPPAEAPSLTSPAPPASLAVTQLMNEGSWELALVYKKTYTFEPDRPCRHAEEQFPLDPDGALHEPIAKDRLPSFKSLPEIVGLKTGTDVVVQAHARPTKPITTMRVSVDIGTHHHEAQVLGKRFCDYVNGKLGFTPPETFEEMPLRHEHAYGGRDEPFERALMAEVERITDKETIRRARPSMEALFKANHPLVYPRNRFGEGYVLEDRHELIEGRELPSLERPEDLLTPEHLVLGHPLDWAKQPLPVGFDYLDPLSFPRSAMLGVPPPSKQPLEEVAEVERGLVPRDYYRGNPFAGTSNKIPDLIHPWGSRCACPDLWLPFLRGDEGVRLTGMDPDHPELCFDLPGETPILSTESRRTETSDFEVWLHTVHIEVPERRLNMTWVARARLRAPLLQGQDQEIASNVKVRMTR